MSNSNSENFESTVDLAAYNADPRNRALDAADVAFVLIATQILMLQIPGVALFQAGMIRRKNALSILMQVIIFVHYQNMI